jgi:hypothetical protein
MKSIFTSRVARVLLVGAVSVSSVAATSPASAVPGFGPQHSYRHNFSGGNWGGYVSFGSFTMATASWTEPSVS